MWSYLLLYPVIIPVYSRHCKKNERVHPYHVSTKALWVGYRCRDAAKVRVRVTTSAPVKIRALNIFRKRQGTHWVMRSQPASRFEEVFEISRVESGRI